MLLSCACAQIGKMGTIYAWPRGYTLKLLRADGPNNECLVVDFDWDPTSKKAIFGTRSRLADDREIDG